MSEQDIAYGGQAVIGGVMIQSPKGWSLGIRDKNNKLHKYYEERIPLIKRNKFWSAPLIRGCLLYTSPSPRDKRQSRMPSSA